MGSNSRLFCLSQSYFVCATNQLALFAAFESISISSLSRLTKATTASMNMGNQVTGALFYGSYSFGLLDFLLSCFSGDLMFCLSVWLAFVYYCSVDDPSGFCSSYGTFWFFVVAHLCLQHWGIDTRFCWLNVFLCLASNLSEVGEACCFSVPSFASRLHLSFLSMSLQHSSGRGFCFPSLWTIKPSKSKLKCSSKSYPVSEYLPFPV